MCASCVDVIRCGRDLDAEHRRAVSAKEGEQFALAHSLEFSETSAKSDDGVAVVFFNVAQKMCAAIREETTTPLEPDSTQRVGLYCRGTLTRSVTSALCCCIHETTCRGVDAVARVCLACHR